MNITTITNEVDYQFVLKEIDNLMNAELNTIEGKLLDNLVSLVEEYETKTFSINKPSFLARIMFNIDNQKMTIRNIAHCFKVDIENILNNTLKLFHIN